MIDEIRGRFQARFLETARRRLGRARALLDDGQQDQARALVIELHSLAGEAALLGFGEVAEAATAAEKAAARWQDSAVGPVPDECGAWMERLHRALAALERGSTAKALSDG